MNRKVNERRRRPQAGVVDTKGRLKIYFLMFMFTSILVTGFFFAGRQHFSSIDFGIKNSRLRKQLDDLETEKRRLLLAREVSLSPAEIKKAARKFGFSGSTPDGIELASSVKTGKAATFTNTSAEKIPAPTVPTYSVVSASFNSISGNKATKADPPDKSNGAERPRQIMKSSVAIR